MFTSANGRILKTKTKQSNTEICKIKTNGMKKNSVVDPDLLNLDLDTDLDPGF
jgi:hypothetical protein